LAGLLYPPLAVVLALISAAALTPLWLGAGLVPGGFGLHLVAVAAAMAHGLFMAIVNAFVRAAGQPLPARLAATARGALWGTAPLGVLTAVVLAVGSISPWLALAGWFLATVAALPSRLASAGWRGDPSRARGASVLQRLVLTTPSLLLLAPVVWLTNAPGASYGLFDGGVVMIPLFVGSVFWASYSCALLAAVFVRPVAGRAG
jgi:hypothetical protein